MFKPRSLTDRVIIVTGAGSGIGQAIAGILASKGARLALCDINENGLKTTASKINAPSNNILVRTVDVTNVDDVTSFAREVEQHFGVVHEVYNNAGIEYHGTFLNADVADMARVMDVNYWGVVNITKAFLPLLIASGSGHLTNVSSLFGLMSVPGQSAYSASKYAVRGLTEAIRQEIIAARHPVGVSCVYPAGVRTPIARNARTASKEEGDAAVALHDGKLAKIDVESAAQVIVHAVQRRRPTVLLSSDAKFVAWALRILGHRYHRPVAYLASRALSKHQQA